MSPSSVGTDWEVTSGVPPRKFTLKRPSSDSYIFEEIHAENRIEAATHVIILNFIFCFSGLFIIKKPTD